MSIRTFLLLTLILASALVCQAQDDTIASPISDTARVYDSVKNNHNPVIFHTLGDSSMTKTDSAVIDSIHIKPVSKPKQRQSELQDKVTYNASDSMRISVDGRKLYMYKDAYVKYQDIVLKADYIVLNFAKNEVFARGMYDSTGKVTGAPNFKKGDESFDCDSMKYNFKTKKGIIYHIISKEGEGFFHSDKTKREANGVIYAQGNKYTTCNLKHPHFYLALNKAIVIPNDKIITGYAYLVVADVPIKIPAIPFGFFPNTTHRASGIIIPTYGEEQTRGFYLTGGGWYQVLGDYADLKILGDAYSKGSWAIHSSLGYKWRYHFRGNFQFDYAINKNNEDITVPTRRDYKLRWSHTQDPKANPTRSFSASVNFSSAEYDKRNSYNASAYLTANKSSSINFTKHWPGTPFSFSASGNASQNVINKTTTMDLPSATFNMSSIYPFRSKNGTGKYKWYENINLGYSATMENNIDTHDSTLFTQETLRNMTNAMQQNIPLSVSFKIGKLITVTPSLTYRGVLHTKYEKHVVTWNDSLKSVKETVDTVHALKYLQAVNPTIGISFTPKIYGMFVSKKDNGYFVAMRHVMSPSASFSFTPDMRKVNPNYWDSLFYSYKDTLGDTKTKLYKVYSPWANEPYGVPSSNGKVGSINLSLNNNLEMKVRPKNDTSGKPKKVVLLDNLNASTSYNLFADSLNWQDISIMGGTRLFNNGIDIRVTSQFSPYAMNSKGYRINKFYYKTNGRLLRFTSFTFATGFSLSSKKKKKGDEKDNTPSVNSNYDHNVLGDDMEFEPRGVASSYTDFNVPWNFNAQISVSYTKTNTENLSATINAGGGFSLTPKWKITVNTGYDIAHQKVTFTNIGVHRDLHCWEMNFTVVPFGPRASYSFLIRAKASVLSDLKYEKRPNYYDHF